jgi:AmpE protein
MKLLVIVLCLLSERFLIHTFSHQRFSWFMDYAALIRKKTDNHAALDNPWLKLALIVLPIIIAVSIIYFLFHNVLYGVGGLVLSVIIFFYCLGPQNPFYPVSESSTESSLEDFSGHYFVMANSQLFAVLFWYLVAGPIAALTYRLISLSQNIDSVSAQSKQVTDVLDWIPARLTALLFLLAGNFQRGFSTFTKLVLSAPDSNDKILSECGMQAVRVKDEEQTPVPVAEELVEHATIVLLVFIALFTLAAWL